MKIIRNGILAALTFLVCGLHAQGPDDQFVKIYNLLLQADQLNDSGQTGQAYQKYMEVRDGLQRLQLGYPSWQPRVIKYRLGYVADKIAPLAIKHKDQPGVTRQTPLAEATAAAAPNAEIAQLELRARNLAEEVDRLRAEKTVLEAKLREALSPHPVTDNRNQLLQSEERIRSLNKELDVLRVQLKQEKEKPPVDPSSEEAGKKALAEANRKLAAQSDSLAALAQEKENLLRQLRRAEKPSPTDARDLERENQKLKNEVAELKSSNRKKPSTPENAEALRKELESVASRLKEQLGQNEVLIAEKRALQSRVDRLSADAKESAAPTPLPPPGSSARRSPDRETESLRRDKSRLEKLVASLSSDLADARKSEKTEARSRIQRLEAERAELKNKLAESAKDAASRPKAPSRAELERLRSQLAAAQARVEAYELKKIPFTAEELAFFKQPKPSPADPKRETTSGKRSVKELPSGARQLVADAQSAFSTRRFDEAEAKYQELLRFDSENVYTLANLALVQIEQGRLDAAEANLTKALAAEPQDAYSLGLFGILRFHQSKLDDALDLLSKSVKIDANNAETHNYLGVVLSRKGMRGPAEAAMRKSIQINPGYAEAHHNLSVIYVSQTPPFVELARWHYEKALSAGHQRNPSLEKYFDKKSVRGE